jgi:plastocyanin
VYDNEDQDIPHNLHVIGPTGGECHISQFNGRGKKVFLIEPLQSGMYSFHCDVHFATMKGKLTAK